MRFFSLSVSSTICDFLEVSTTVKVVTVSALFFGCVALQCCRSEKKRSVSPDPSTPTKASASVYGNDFLSPRTPPRSKPKQSSSIVTSAMTPLRLMFGESRSNSPTPPEGEMQDDGTAAGYDSDYY